MFLQIFLFLVYSKIHFQSQLLLNDQSFLKNKLTYVVSILQTPRPGLLLDLAVPGGKTLKYSDLR